MKEKISVKTLYLLGIITIGLIGLGLGSTYAMFTASTEIDNPISISTNLNSEDDIIETIEVTIDSNRTKEIPITINNSSTSTLNYAVWYTPRNASIKVGTNLSNSDSSSPTGTITSNTTKKVYVQLKNTTLRTITITLGVSSNTTNVIISNSMTLVPNKALPSSLAETITELYTSATKTPVINNNITYQYDTTNNLMADVAGNIRYYGKSNTTNVPAWQSTATETLFGTYDSEAACLEGFETNYNICSPDVAGYENYGYSDQATCEAEYDWGSDMGEESMTYNEGKQKYCTGTGKHYEPVEINNYIYFNCSDYSNQSSSTCETWRIIGVFDGKVKIMKGSIIGTYSWDNKSTSTGAETAFGKNDWATARLMKLLNPNNYYTIDSNDNGNGQSLYWNAQSGTCFSGSGNATKTCNFTSTGLKNDTTRNLISEETYTIKGYNKSDVFSNIMYDKERVSGTVYTGRPTTWKGKISLPYVSDYGYATDLNQCQKTLFDYNNSTCTANNWMKNIITNNEANNGWLLTPNSGDADSAWFVHSSGYVNYTSYAYIAYGVAPVLYLDSKLDIGPGTGTSSSPYQLLIN